jgi:hypothetical protein
MTAQPDALRDCRRQAAVATNAAISEIDARRDQELKNGNSLILWSARIGKGRSLSGSCEADARTGRIVRFESDPAGDANNRRETISTTDAESTCQREAQRRFRAGDSEIKVTLNADKRPTYYVEWVYAAQGRTVAKGWCEIEPSDGSIRDFEPGGGWNLPSSAGGGGVGNQSWANRFGNPGAGNQDTIRATIRGGVGPGKCTFEVEVDGAAEVEIRGDQGTLRTISGSPARWLRLDCNQAMPGNPADFRFTGVDGRGRQGLIRDPVSNRGTAVIRIEDPKGGRENYTGDVTWR